ncbi:MAG: hypothetical protein JNL64_16325 [Blastocatellia bacterium]|nr:hypothetical protein [Blastocatellia bacterium]
MVSDLLFFDFLQFVYLTVINTGSVLGKATRVSSSVSKTNYTAFDVFGRMTAYQQITDGTVYSTEYKYNLSGGLVKETHQSGREVTNTLDANGDMTSTVDPITSLNRTFLFNGDNKQYEIKDANGTATA